MKKQAIKVMATAALLTSVAAPFAANSAFASAQYTVSGVQNITNSTSTLDLKNLGSVKVDVPQADLTTNDYFYLRLPSDFQLFSGVAVDSTTDLVAAGNATIIGAFSFVGSSDPFILAGDTQAVAVGKHLSVFKTADNELKVVVKNVARENLKTDADSLIKINLANVFVPSGSDNTINAVIEGKNGSPFISGSVTVATKGSGSVATTIDSTKYINDKTLVSATNAIGAATKAYDLPNVDTIRVKEDRPGAWLSGQTVKYKLPAGFKWRYFTLTNNAVAANPLAVPPVVAAPATTETGTWNDVSATAANAPSSNVAILDGDAFTTAPQFYTEDSGRTLVVKFQDQSSASARYVQLKNFGVEVSDSSLAKAGEVDAVLGGSASYTTAQLPVANFGTYGTSVSAADATTVTAGMTGSKLAKLTIQENAPASLINGRTIKLTLSGNAKFTPAAYPAAGASWNGVAVKDIAIDPTLSDLQGVTLSGWTFDGEDGQTIKATVTSPSNGTKGSKIVLKDVKVDVPADAGASDISVSASGTAGVEGDFGVVAKTAPIVSATASATPDIILGTQDQPIGDITVTEAAAGNIDAATGNNQVVLTFPAGVTPSLPTSTTVTDGDLAISTQQPTKVLNVVSGKYQIVITTKATSSKASTIKVSGIKITTDRTVPVGAVKVDVGGSAIVESSAAFPNTGKAVSVVAGNTVTGIDTSKTSSTVVFTVGKADYTSNGVAGTLDVAPYIKNSRTYVPVRALSEALGATVGWDQASQTVSILKDGRAVSVKIGSQIMNVGGVPVALDVAPEITNDRTFLPFRAIAEALGATVAWDEATQTVTIK